ncbi:hypothetical protein CYMTET_35001 [Cymbomonas tetramitiformis]|uniref:Uncharacterized protein n=1 Tax=Cymbomonas tetramitiformis TaxID=36881 RepID=A0AAE0KPB6_9CHLO|nr:hypothetical protein CYMTET_35001 [Cymbomonas tetramitiformis]
MHHASRAQDGLPLALIKSAGCTAIKSPGCTLARTVSRAQGCTVDQEPRMHPAPHRIKSSGCTAIKSPGCTGIANIEDGCFSEEFLDFEKVEGFLGIDVCPGCPQTCIATTEYDCCAEVYLDFLSIDGFEDLIEEMCPCSNETDSTGAHKRLAHLTDLEYSQYCYKASE